MSERFIWEGWCSLDVPRGWSWTQEEGVITLFRDNGVGALHLSFGRRERLGPVDSTEALELASSWARSRGWTDIGIRSVVLAGGPSAEFKYVEKTNEESTFWDVWYLVEHQRAALFTYVCESADAGVEENARERIVASFTWR